jgi:hypothetical protein
VGCAGDQLKVRAGNAVGEFAALGGGNPGVVGAPEDPGRDGDVAVAVLDLVGVALVGLGDLPVEGGLAGLVG